MYFKILTQQEGRVNNFISSENNHCQKCQNFVHFHKSYICMCTARIDGGGSQTFKK